MHVARDPEPDSYGALCPRDRGTIHELLDTVLPNNPRPDLLRSNRHGHWHVSQLLNIKAPGLTLRKATPVDHESKCIEHLFEQLLVG